MVRNTQNLKQMKLLISALAILLVSCRAGREVIKERIVTDSTYYHKYNELEKEYQAEKRAMEEEKRLWAEYGVLFADEKPCDSVNTEKPEVKVSADKPVNKVKVKADGSIEIEGKIKAFNAQLSTYQRLYDSTVRELQTEKSKVDSLAVELSKKSVGKQVENKCLWWVWFALGMVSGVVIWHNRKKILSLIKLIKL